MESQFVTSKVYFVFLYVTVQQRQQQQQKGLLESITRVFPLTARLKISLSAVEEVASRLSQTKEFTVVDAKVGFWQKRLDIEASDKTTLNTPFGWHRWNRMSVNIFPGSEVWQRIMQGFVEDLEGVELIADDFLTPGFRSSGQEVNNSLERHERALFEKCRLWNLKLNHANVNQHQSGVKFMGQLLTF